MIRILHTADWHIGHTLRGYGRESEHVAVFDQLVNIVADREIDVILVAGDVFDSQNPSGEALGLFYRTLSRLRMARPQLKIIVVAGNHDSANRLEAPHALLSSLDMHVIGSVRRQNGRALSERHLIPVHDAAGQLRLHILAVSHLTPGCLPHLSRLQDESGSLVGRKVQELYTELYEQSQPHLQNMPLIVTGHLHVIGGDVSEASERRILVGGEHAVSHTVFPPTACYVALGHLHKPQQAGAAHIRYSGSLFPLSASEHDYRHGVILVTIDDGSLTCEDLLIERPVPFFRVPANGSLRWRDVPAQLAALHLQTGVVKELQPFVQVRLERENLPPGFREELDRLAEGYAMRMLEPSIGLSNQEVNLQATAPELLRSVSDHQPEELFRLAFEQRLEREPSTEHLEIFHRVVAEAGV